MHSGVFLNTNRMRTWKDVSEAMVTVEEFKPHNTGRERAREIGGERESALSLAVQGSRECEAHPSAGLTNSHANTHLAVTLKSKGSKTVHHCFARKRKKRPKLKKEEAQRETQ